MSNDGLLIIGEALIDVVHRLDGSVDEVPGGSPANVAITLGRLGRTPHLLTWVGDDAAGQRIAQWLRASGVVVEPSSFGSDHTSTATAVLGEDGGARYIFDIDWNIPADVDLSGIGHVHVGSIGAVLEPAAGPLYDLLSALKVAGATISYDPNARPAIMEAPEITARKFARLVAISDVVKVSDEDLEWVAPGESYEDVARRWAASGPGLVIVTRGGSGALAFTEEANFEVDGVSVEVVDTVGAGDTFMGALIDGLLSAGALGYGHQGAVKTIDHEALVAVLNRCARAAAVTVSRPGADPPTLAELDG
ncbi:carbohydrate kinase [Rarobacter faecitabidus]|uniref:Fructokinase n=1 Tax=Rarobacter faecitabidus TaxID=13243 RepID=A0A542ZU47_RARFA|nr:carbohydrate kinase [Rarobacter faecitabidus]TQL63847.1 fructokinase [Rarobacter faecitabidus]